MYEQKKTKYKIYQFNILSLKFLLELLQFSHPLVLIRAYATGDIIQFFKFI